MYKGNYSQETRLKMISILGDQDDFDYLHDILIEIYDNFHNLKDENKIKIYIDLLLSAPDNILGDIYSFGFSDTVVRDNIYEFVSNNKEYFSKITGLF